MRRYFCLLCCLACWLSIQGQPNINVGLVANLPHEDAVNDVWGYVDADGNEYAALGTSKGVSIISLINPSNPVELAYFEGVTTNWRDMKSYDHFIYAVADGRNSTEGLMIIDMSGAPNDITVRFHNPELVINGDTSALEACHNLFIDEKGYGYIAGCNVNNGGILFFDFFTDPSSPSFISAGDPRYSHDVFVRGDTMWSSDIYESFVSVTDVSDKLSPQLLATQATSLSFTHNAWLSDDGQYLFTTDELPDAFTDAYDVSDLSDIKKIDRYRPPATLGTGVAPHNVYYYNGYLVISHYSDGVKIVDAHKPDNLIEVGGYDTYESGGTGFNGCWGVYPYLPSGLILASDRVSGLFVLAPNYSRASYLEGIVQDEDSNAFLSGVDIKILDADANFESSDNFGAYKTGLAQAGNYEVLFTLPGYEDKTALASLINGQVTILNVKLKKLPTHSISGLAIQDDNEFVIPNAKVQLNGDDFSYTTQSDAFGNFDLEEVVQGDYEISVGKWGFENIFLQQTIDNSSNIIARLKKGYRDDFVVDQGWTVESNARKGIWEIGEPIGTYFGGELSNPDMDLENDRGDYCYMTGNGGGSVGFDDVDEGRTVLISPKMTFEDYDNPVISFYYWFYNDSGAKSPNDSLKIYLSNGKDTTFLHIITESNSQWSERMEHLVSDYFELDDTLQIFFETEDQAGMGNLVEAAVDFFLVSEGSPTSTNNAIEVAQIKAYPNPFFNQLRIDYELPGEAHQTQFLLYNILGRLVKKIPIRENSGSLIIEDNLAPGNYFLQLVDSEGVLRTLKLIKLKD